MTCTICNGEKRVKVGVSFPPRKTIAFKVEYDPCPGCTPGPHTFHAKQVAQRIIASRATNLTPLPTAVPENTVAASAIEKISNAIFRREVRT